MAGQLNVAETLRRQFAYDAWANREALISIKKDADENARSLQLMSHILAAERLWLDRLMGVHQSVAVWPGGDLARCEAEIEELTRAWAAFLDKTSDLSQTISYKNSKGEPWTSTILDVLTHVVIHSAHHRGQIASHMRAKGQTPAYTDFIHGARQGLFH
jgi:uncharacterized damage-inducible protein DinB